ncbi:major capsid protein [Rhizobium sp. 268]|uniref:major capsid protein n=1 Tax=Rhizobium sp. 268 TaxID=2996375 RepID=UPI002F941D50
MSLTAAINILPPRATTIEGFATFAESGITTTTVAVEEKDGKIGIVKSQPRGFIGRGQSSKKRRMRKFDVPHYPEFDAIMASEVQGVRAFGSENTMESVDAKLAEKRSDLVDLLNTTIDAGKWGAVQGVLYDADGSILFDWHDEFGVARNEFSIDLSDATLNLRDEVIKLKRAAEKELGGYTWSKFTLALPAAVFDKFVSHPSLKEAYDRWQDGAFLRADNRAGFMIADNVEVKSVDITDLGNGLTTIPNDEGFLIPNAGGLLKVNYSPADTLEAANTIGLPYYMGSELMPFGKGVDLIAETNFLAYCEKPRAIVRILFG